MSSERRTPPSARRLKKARDEGRVAFSSEAAAALTLLCFVLGAGAFDPVAQMARLLEAMLEEAPAPGVALMRAALTLALGVLPCLLVASGIGVGLGLLQTRGLLTLVPLRPDLARLSPVAGLRRLFGLDRLFPAFRGLGLTLLGLPLLGAVGLDLAPILVGLFARPHMGGGAGDGSGVAALLATVLLGRVLGVGVGLLCVSGVVDLLWRRHRHRRTLFTTEQEQRDEHRREEGDPRHRQARQKMHRHLALSSPPPMCEAKVLLLNPTRLAVALHHDTLDALPTVGATAAGLQASRMRARARRAGIPLLRDRTLARALFALEPGDEIPAALYRPVAAVLAGLYRAGLATAPGDSPSPGRSQAAVPPDQGDAR